MGNSGTRSLLQLWASHSSLIGRTANRDQVRLDGHSMNDSHVEKGLKWSDIAGLGHLQTLQQFLDGIFAANVFHGCLRAEGGVASQDQNGL